MIGIKCLRLTLVKPRVAQRHRQAPWIQWRPNYQVVMVVQTWRNS
jgi:hypothetical protein